MRYILKALYLSIASFYYNDAPTVRAAGVLKNKKAIDCVSRFFTILISYCSSQNRRKAYAYTFQKLRRKLIALLLQLKVLLL